MHHDPPEAQRLRAELVARLRESGRLRDKGMVDAFTAIPRHLFVPDHGLAAAYHDRALSTKMVANEVVSSISQPTMIAIMLQQLALAPGQRILEIGAGTGYQAALMARLVGPAGHVVTIDIDDDIVAAARRHLAAAGSDNVTVIQADGSAGHAAGGPYDRIILTVAAADIAPAWWQQIRPGGRLVLPLVLQEPGWQQCTVFQRRVDHFRSLSTRSCRFIQLRGALAAPAPPLTSLDPAGQLQLTGNAPVPAATIAAWLARPAASVDSGVDIQFGPLLAALTLWLSLHEPDLAFLHATGPAPAHFPVLFQTKSPDPMAHTYALFQADGAAALCQPLAHGEARPPVQFDERFRVHVCQLGLDDRPAQRLLRLIQTWNAAGRPLIRDLSLRAYRQPAAATGDFEINRAQTRFVIDWRPGQGAAQNG